MDVDDHTYEDTTGGDERLAVYGHLATLERVVQPTRHDKIRVDDVVVFVMMVS